MKKDNITYEQAQKQALKVKWRTVPCFEGETCWCRMIVPVEPIIFDGDDYYYIVGSGSIPQLEAEHIVELHNNNLDL